MKLRKLMAGGMAAAMMMTSAIVCPYYASAERVSQFSANSFAGDSVDVYFDLTATDAVSWAQAEFIISTWNNTASAGDWIEYGFGGADQEQWWTGEYGSPSKFWTTYSENLVNHKITVDITDYDNLDNFEVLVENSDQYVITINKVDVLDNGEVTYTWTNPALDTTEYAWQTISVPTPNGTNYTLPGKFISDNISGDNAGIEFTVDIAETGQYAGMNLVDNTGGAWTKIGNDVNNNDATSATFFYKFSDLTGALPTDAGVFVVSCYNGATLTGIRIKNDATKDDVYVENIEIPATSVTIDPEEVTLDLGIEAQKTATLTATVEPDDTTDELEWTTSDDTVVTVADGVLTAVGIGTATITATAGEQSDTCAVTVQKTSKITADYNAEQGTVTVAETAVNGDEVTVTATPKAGYKVSSITVGNTEVTDGKFTMPAEDVTVYVTFEAIEYTITVADTTNGTVTVEPAASTIGAEILITATPDTYYVADTVTATTAGGEDVTVTDNVFTMPADNVTVNVTFALNDEVLAYDIYQAVESLISGEVSSSTYKDKAAYVAAIEAAIADIEFDGLTVNADDIVFTAPTEDAAGSITGKINVSSGTIFETEVLELNVTIKAIPTDPVELAAEALEAFLATYTATNDTHATNLSNEMNAIVAEASPNAMTDISILVTQATYTEAGNVHFVIKIKAEGYDIKEITKDIPIAQLEKTDAMLIEEAKAAAEAAIADVTAADDITKALITEAVANTDITVDVKSEETTAPTTTAVGVQTVTITLTLGEESATITKTFDIAKLVAVESVSLDKTTAELLTGDTVTLTATVTPDNAADKSVTWKSSDTAVATVADGVVTAVAAGEATITVTTTDGGKTATCAVTVTAPVEPEPEEPEEPEPEEPDEPEPDEPTIPEDEIVIWTGSTDLGTSWGTSITATFDVSKLAAGDTVKVYYTAGTAATYQQVKLMDADWKPLTSPTGMNEWDCVDLAADKTEYSFAISAADVKALNGTMIVSGYNATITGISIIPAASEDEPASGYTDDDTTIPVGKTMTQKTAVNEDGFFNQRFVQKVSVADLANATKIVFTVSNGTKTVKYESTECYSSLNVNGGALDAGEGYVFVVLTIKDIPDGKNVTIVSIDIV